MSQNRNFPLKVLCSSSNNNNTQINKQQQNLQTNKGVREVLVLEEEKAETLLYALLTTSSFVSPSISFPSTSWSSAVAWSFMSASF